ncbi:MAG: MerR family transcriptional regulator [Maledivibacter sp.]|nr:MerR family transcriptional regulator [Maledivibacter sp.]
MIDNKKRYSISEASELIGFANHVLRFYEKEFEIEVPRNRSGHRYYTYVEIEKFLYIKTLKERGLSNKQIKTILSSPEEIINMNEVAAASYSSNDKVENEVVAINTVDMDFTNNLSEIKNLLEEKLDGSFKSLSSTLVKELKSTLNDFDAGYKNEDKDTLISENARLKMKLKEKSYETANLREKLKKLENKRGSFFKKLFSDSKNRV